MEKLWPAGVVLVVAILIAVVWPPASTVTRLTNMDLSASEFPDTYLMISKTDESKAYVVDRRDSTIRRSNNKQPGRKWDVFRISDDHDGRLVNTWMVQSKKKGKGTVFFLPAIAVDEVVGACQRIVVILLKCLHDRLEKARIQLGVTIRTHPLDGRKKVVEVSRPHPQLLIR